ncbi:hypothetical protein MCEMSEM23_03183 [Rhabdaerophilaceae bacterium]
MTPDLDRDLRALAQTWQEPSQPQATFLVAGEVLQRHIGFGLYTITHILPGGLEVERIFSTNPTAYAVGGRKPVLPSAFRDQVFGSMQPFLGRRPADFIPYFPDHAFIVSLGLGAVINVPLIFDGAGLASLNILDREGAYDDHHLAPAMAIARMIVPALLKRHFSTHSTPPT